MAHKTKVSPLVIEGVEDITFRHRPLPAFAAADEFLELTTKLESSGALDLLVEAGTGVKLDPSSWDVSDVALAGKVLTLATGKAKASDAFIALFSRYSVEYKLLDGGDDNEWCSLDDLSDIAIDPSVLPFVAFACLRGSVVPFFDRLKSFGKAKAEKQAQPSPTSEKAS